MKLEELKQEIKELQEKLNEANKLIYMQMEVIQELNNICGFNDKAHRRERDRKRRLLSI